MERAREEYLKRSKEALDLKYTYQQGYTFTSKLANVSKKGAVNTNQRNRKTTSPSKSFNRRAIKRDAKACSVTSRLVA